MSSKKDKVLFALTLICLAISSFSLLGVAEGSFDEEFGSKTVAISVAISFWAGLIIGYIFLIVLNSHRKKARKKASGRQKADGYRCGAISFFSNSAAIIADSVMIISLIVFIIFRMLEDVSEYLDLAVIAVFVYSVHLHGILNGRNFRFVLSAPAQKLNIQDKKSEAPEQNKSEQIEKSDKHEDFERGGRYEPRRSSEQRNRSEQRYRTEQRNRPEQRYRENKSDKPEKRN